MRGTPPALVLLPVVIDQLAVSPELRDVFPLADALDHAIRDNA